MRALRRVTSIVAVSVVGSLLIAAGAVMLVTPGPGLLAIVAGLAVWSREFRWAHRLLARARDRVTRTLGQRRPVQPTPIEYAPDVHLDPAPPRRNVA